MPSKILHRRRHLQTAGAAKTLGTNLSLLSAAFILVAPLNLSTIARTWIYTTSDTTHETPRTTPSIAITPPVHAALAHSAI
ncbi:hypothetical protein Purlil1_12317 [Purpureocillium lilacinum]|uniref:Uncharacterized protein n=1 Tax=Purpureocillium lilacinum TaxID=33203 RepID=A0ABR0BH50_PURLI|nr:hypothetical protein Purlil1_12317 [Purpureocillium lilacinum]